MQDQAHVFGEWDNLVGVYTPAEHDQRDWDSTVVVMVTPGMLHHVGPFGLHVALARSLAEQGIASFRFCLSGIGESLGIGQEGTSTQRAVHEIREALNLIERTYGKRRVVLFGLCSGADDSVNAALADSRIVAIGLLDGCGFRTPGYFLRRWTVWLPNRLRRFWQKRHQQWSHPGGGDQIPATLPAGDDIREFPTRQRAEKEFCALIQRGVECLFLYTGGVAEYYNSSRQFGEMFPQLRGHARIQVDYFPKMDHIARLIEDRETIVHRLQQWMIDRVRDPGVQSKAG